MQIVSVAVKPMIAWLSRGLMVVTWTDGKYGTNGSNGHIPSGNSSHKSRSFHKSHCPIGPPRLTQGSVFRIISAFRLPGAIIALKRETVEMSYAIIKTGGKQFAVEDGQKLRVPTIEGKAGSKIDVEALVLGAGKDAKIGGGTVKATVVGHGRGEKVIVFKKKRRKQYKRKQGHRQGYTEIKIDKI